MWYNEELIKFRWWSAYSKESKWAKKYFGVSLSPPRLNIITLGNMGVMICLGQGGLCSPVLLVRFFWIMITFAFNYKTHTQLTLNGHKSTKLFLGRQEGLWWNVWMRFWIELYWLTNIIFITLISYVFPQNATLQDMHRDNSLIHLYIHVVFKPHGTCRWYPLLWPSKATLLYNTPTEILCSPPSPDHWLCPFHRVNWVSTKWPQILVK